MGGFLLAFYKVCESVFNDRRLNSERYHMCEVWANRTVQGAVDLIHYGIIILKAKFWFVRAASSFSVCICSFSLTILLCSILRWITFINFTNDTVVVFLIFYKNAILLIVVLLGCLLSLIILPQTCCKCHLKPDLVIFLLVVEMSTFIQRQQSFI